MENNILSAIDRLRNKIEQEFKSEIKTRPDCEKLAIEIWKRTDIKISYNTLRRFFNLAGNKGTSRPSYSTLNILSNYVGYHSFYQIGLGEGIQSMNTEDSYELLIQFQNCGKIDRILVEDAIQKINIQSDLYNFFFKIVSLSFLIDDKEFIRDLFNFHKVFQNQTYLQTHIYYTLISTGLYVRKSKLKYELWDRWASQKTAQSFYFELFVDMDYLLVDHYIALEKYNLYKTTSEANLFVNSLLYFRAYMIEDEISMGECMNKMNNIEINASIHPIPIARYLTCKLLSENRLETNIDSSTYQEIEGLVDRIRQHGVIGKFTSFFHIWLLEGLVLSRRYQLANKLILSLEKYGKEDHNYYNKGDWERYKMYKAYTLYANENYPAAKFLFETINYKNFHVFSQKYDLIFYLILEGKIFKDNSKIVDANKIARKIKYTKLISLLS